MAARRCAMLVVVGTTGQTNLPLQMAEAAFRAAAARPDPPGWTMPRPAPPPTLFRPRKRNAGPLIVVLDPGHGGIDPGAVDGKLHEADIVLDRTPFYAEGGGQLADAGVIQLAGGGVIEVHDVQAPVAVRLPFLASGGMGAGVDAVGFPDAAKNVVAVDVHLFHP